MGFVKAEQEMEGVRVTHQRGDGSEFSFITGVPQKYGFSDSPPIKREDAKSSKPSWLPCCPISEDESFYAFGEKGHPNLGESLRFSYHESPRYIHRDDYEIFKERIYNYLSSVKH